MCPTLAFYDTEHSAPWLGHQVVLQQRYSTLHMVQAAGPPHARRPLLPSPKPTPQTPCAAVFDPRFYRPGVVKTPGGRPGKLAPARRSTAQGGDYPISVSNEQLGKSTAAELRHGLTTGAMHCSAPTGPTAVITESATDRSRYSAINKMSGKHELLPVASWRFGDETNETAEVYRVVSRTEAMLSPPLV